MKSTKRALISSVLSMVLCVILLVGTTFAWFSSTLETTANELYAGNLDVSLQYSHDYRLTDNTWKDVTPDTSDLFFGVDLWEPGMTNVLYLKLTKNGTLAAKYEISFKIEDTVMGTNVLGEEFGLSEFIRLGYNELTDGVGFATADEARKAVNLEKSLKTQNGCVVASGELKGNVTEKLLAVVLYMPNDVGNAANYRPGTATPKVAIQLKLVATQTSSETDLFNAQYDSGVPFPGGEVEGVTYNDTDKIATVNTAVGFSDFMSGDKSNYAVALGADIDFGNAKVDAIRLTSLDGKGYAIKNAKADNFLFTGTNGGVLSSVKNLTLENIVITGAAGEETSAGIFDGAAATGAVFENVTAKNCTVSGAAYCGSLVGSVNNAGFANCNAISCNVTASKAAGTLIGRVQASSGADVTITNCTADGGKVAVDADKTSAGALIGRASILDSGTVTATGAAAANVTVSVGGDEIVADLIGDTDGSDGVTVNGVAYKK